MSEQYSKKFIELFYEFVNTVSDLKKDVQQIKERIDNLTSENINISLEVEKLYKRLEQK